MDPWHPQDLGLSKYHRNDIFRAIEAGGALVTEFKLTVRKDLDISSDPYDYVQPYLRQNFNISPPMPVTLIRHRISKSFFGIRKLSADADVFDTRQQIGGIQTEEQAFDRSRSGSRQPWESVLRRVQSWIIEIGQFLVRAEEYARTPDLWDELYQAKKYFTGPHEQRFNNAPFTASEQAEISSQIKETKAYVKTAYQLTTGQISRVEARLDDAEEASGRMGRKDWLMLFYGAVTSLTLGDFITPQIAQHIFLLTIHGLSHLFGFGGPPPHLPPGG